MEASDFSPEITESDQARIASLAKLGKDVTRWLGTRTIDATWARQQYDAKSDSRVFDNELVCLCDSQLILVGESSAAKFLESPLALVYFWENRLCPMWTLSIRWEPRKVWRAFIVNKSREFELLCSTPVKFLLLYKDTCVAALEVDLASADPEVWGDTLDRAQEPYQHFGDHFGGKVYAEAHATIPRSPQEHLRKGWVVRLNREVDVLYQFFKDRDHDTKWQDEKARLPKTGLGATFTKDNCLAKLYEFYRARFWVDGDNPVPHSLRLGNDLQNCPLHLDAALTILDCAWFSAEGTSAGHRIQSVDLDGGIRPVPIDVNVLGEKCKVFWSRLPFTLPLYYREIIGGGNCSVEMISFVRSMPLYEGDPKEGEESLNNLLAEATSLKQWTIPFGAYVLLSAGEIEAAKLYEIGTDVAILLIDRKGDYFHVWSNPAEKLFSFAQGAEAAWTKAKLGEQGSKASTVDEVKNSRAEFEARFGLGIKILLASIIRDFWVVEERERVFGASMEVRKSPRLRADRGRLRIVYLPRIRYVNNFKDQPDGLNLKARAPHFVVGHLRKALQASEDQIILARQYGIIVPEGFTFVRPHRRGDAAQERIYRSRSALQCLQALKPVADSGTRDSWFTFELNVREWLANNGFHVEHLAASRNGDGGVDIQASKGNEHLLVQCKYWHGQNVGPNVIREMLGTLQTFPPGSKGVIVTSSELTSAAKELAVEHGIQFIERVNFSAGIQRKL
jgi:restriction endonuclease